MPGTIQNARAVLTGFSEDFILVSNYRPWGEIGRIHKGLLVLRAIQILIRIVSAAERTSFHEEIS
jgi:hypothetical protein